MIEITEAQAGVLGNCSDRWQRPMDMGGRDGSPHSGVLAALVRKGLVERKYRGSSLPPGSFARGSYVYRITPAGEAFRQSQVVEPMDGEL